MSSRNSLPRRLRKSRFPISNLMRQLPRRCRKKLRRTKTKIRRRKKRRSQRKSKNSSKKRALQWMRLLS